MPRKGRPARRTSAARAAAPAPKAVAHGPEPTDESILPAYIAPLPTAHAICRNCGRIMRVSLPGEDVAALQAFIDRRPDGWNVEGMSISFTGLCSKCRVGPPL